MASSRPNPTARNSESKDPMRKCFRGNPFAKPSSIIANSSGGFNPNTPVNSPSDFPRRSSFGRENSISLPDYEDKENSKSSNLRPGRVPSPASTSKGTKNFMSPTISAASKFTTSPRKKILVERNEPFRSSVLFPDAKSQVMEDNNVKLEICSNKKKTVSFADAISLLTEDEPSRSSVLFPNAEVQVMEENNVKPEVCSNKKTAAFADAISQSTEDEDLSKPEMSLKEKKIDASLDSTVTDMGPEEALKSDSHLDSVVPVDLKNDIDPTFKISPRISSSTASPMLAPLDADPLMPPYDPKTNYLSPRPQFLHYMPNPRIELMHNRDGNLLDERFISENLSDSEVNEPLFEETQKDCEDVSSDETVKEEEEEEINVPAHKPKEIVQSKVESKSKYCTKSKFIALLVALVFAFTVISVSDSTVTNLSVLKDLSLYDLYIPPEIPEFAKVKFEGLVRKSRLWAADSFSYICELISELRGAHRLSHLQFSNLSAWLEDNHLVDGYLKFAGAEFNNKENLMAPTGERDFKTKQLGVSNWETEENEEDIEEVSEDDNSAGFEGQVQQDIEADDNIVEVLEDHTEPESEEVCLTSPAEVIKPADVEAEQTEGTVRSDVNNDIKLQSNIDVTEVEISEVTEIQPEVHEAEEPQVESDENSYTESETTKAGENTQNTELDASSEDNPIPQAEDKFVTRNVVGISSFVLLSLLAGTVFLFNHAKKGKLLTPDVTTSMGQSVMTKKLDYSPISGTVEHRFEQKLASRKWQTEVDVSGESASSEISSFKSSSQSKKRLKTSSAAQSQERKPRKNYRRESLASSDFSLSSVSYGSFTTYEKIPSKHGCGDEEVVTPVRRSSRVRNLASSP